MAKRVVPDMLQSSVRRLDLLEDTLDRQRQRVTGDKGVLLVPRRDGAGLSWIERIDLLPKVGALIDRFRVSIAQQEL